MAFPDDFNDLPYNISLMSPQAVAAGGGTDRYFLKSRQFATRWWTWQTENWALESESGESSTAGWEGNENTFVITPDPSWELAFQWKISEVLYPGRVVITLAERTEDYIGISDTVTLLNPTNPASMRLEIKKWRRRAVKKIVLDLETQSYVDGEWIFWGSWSNFVGAIGSAVYYPGAPVEKGIKTFKYTPGEGDGAVTQSYGQVPWYGGVHYFPAEADLYHYVSDKIYKLAVPHYSGGPQEDLYQDWHTGI